MAESGLCYIRPKKMFRISRSLSIIFIAYLFVASCTTPAPVELKIKVMDPAETASLSQEIRSKVAAELDSGLTLKLWGVDSLVADPIALDLDHKGRVYITRTNRQTNSEFDIRNHRDWEINSIRLQSPAERAEFLKLELSPDSSDVNDWFTDLNGDSIRDWRDLLVEKEQIYRLDDTNGDGVADRSMVIAEGFNGINTDPAGALEIFEDNVFMGAGPDMWRLRDIDGDGYTEKVESISHGFAVHIGFGAHGMSGAEMGPDGRLYWGIGDIGFNGKGPDGKEWKYPNRGVIVRSELDGSNFEVFAMGLRNTHEFVFDQYANLISEDNDGDHPGESERLVYVVEGSDTGWRINWQFGKYNDPKNNRYKVWMDERLNVPRWEGQAAHITPCIRNYVNGPTGMLYNPGTALGPDWKDYFFIVEFVGTPGRSGIHAFKLKPEGATFVFDSDKKILGGVLPTGIDWGPDGAMYVADWIEGWGTKDYGRIWKLDDEAGANWRLRQSTARWMAADYSSLTLEELEDLLHHEDMRIRQKSQFELVKRGDEGHKIFTQTLANSDNQLARIHSIWGMAQMARTQEMSFASPIVQYLQDEDAEIKAQAAKWLGDIRYSKAGDAIIPLLADDQPRVRFFAAEALGRMQHSAASDEIIKMLIANDDQDAYLRHAGSLALARFDNADLLVSLQDHTSRALRLASVVALRRMEHPGVASYLDDSDVAIVRDAARAINDDWSIPDALDELAAILNETPLEDEVIIRRSINANLRVGSDECIERLITYASNKENPDQLRMEALSTLEHWEHPSVLDRVDGRYRGEIKRNLSSVKSNFSPAIMALMKEDKSGIQKGAIQIAGQWKLQEAQPIIRDFIRNGEYGSIREASVLALVNIKDDQLVEYLKIALDDPILTVRNTALRASLATKISDEDKLSLLRNVIFEKPFKERQSAIASLPDLPTTITRSTFEELIKHWEANELVPEIRLDVSEAIEATGDPALAEAIASVRKTMSEGSVMDIYGDCLTGGDPRKGSTILWRHTGAQCMRCHVVHDYGGIAGPELTHIADLLTPEQLLESLVDPNARIAPGYGMVSLILNDDSEVDGMLIRQSDDQLTLRDADNNEIEVAIADIAERIDGVSGMLDMKNILTKKEIRDMVAYLKTLKGPPSS